MKIVIRTVMVLMLAVVGSGCATILSGKSQSISIESNPPGARCELLREGRVIGSVENTPGAVMVERTKHDIDVVCRKSGFGESKSFAESGTEGATFGNILLGGVVGWGVDSAVGADNKYPEKITVNLAARPARIPSAPAVPAKAPAVVGAQDSRKRLAALKEMRDQGELTEEEYQAKRAQIVELL